MRVPVLMNYTKQGIMVVQLSRMNIQNVSYTKLHCFSDANIASLEQEIHSLQSEMKELRKRANEQSLILTKLCENPKLSTLHQTIQQMSSWKSGLWNLIHLVSWNCDGTSENLLFQVHLQQTPVNAVTTEQLCVKLVATSNWCYF